MRKVACIKIGMMLCSCVCILASCLKNDFPYPTVKLTVTGFTVEGQKGSSIISKEDRTVTVELEETVNIHKVHIQSLEVSDGGRASIPSDTVVDLVEPLKIKLILYQDYEWSIVAKQTIERRFSVKGQVGSAVFYPERHEARIDVVKGTDLNQIELIDLKLSPIGGTVDGSTSLPDLKWEIYNNYALAEITTDYQDVKGEKWKLYVFETDKNILIKSVDAWTNVAWLYGSGVIGADNGFEYKEKDSEEWIRVDELDITHDGGEFMTRLTHLKPSTTYVCRAYSGEEFGAEESFTTGTAATIPNLEFEEWHEEASGSKNIIQPWPEGGTSFWDTGNDGTITLNKNVTQSTDEVWQGAAPGSKAAKLASQFVGIAGIGKFASGNLFTGEFREVVGTNGILGFGREFSERPTRLKGHFKYTTAEVGYADEAHQFALGKPDTCIVWMALGDWDEPVEIKTNPKDAKYFDQNDPKIIAYGEMCWSETISEYRDFEIELNYRSTSRVPKFLLIICSASKYGDYFTGADGAILWVDDFALEYDYD